MGLKWDLTGATCQVELTRLQGNKSYNNIWTYVIVTPGGSCSHYMADDEF